MPVLWDVEQMRVSVFFVGDIAPSEKYWHLLTGEAEAPNRLSTPTGRAYVGDYLGGQLALTYSPQRLDAVLSSAERDEPTEFAIPKIGRWDEVSSRFVAKIGEALLSGFEVPINRIAVGAVLLAATPSREENYRLLGSLLKSVQLTTDMRDFLFRCNWPLQSRVQNSLSINRLTTWTSVQFVRKLVSVTGSPTSTNQPTQVLHAARLEMDHNTDPAHVDAFEKSLLVPIFKELVELVAENAEKGECR
jgi:hypothetical protein